MVDDLLYRQEHHTCPIVKSVGRLNHTVQKSESFLYLFRENKINSTVIHLLIFVVNLQSFFYRILYTSHVAYSDPIDCCLNSLRYMICGLSHFFDEKYRLKESCHYSLQVTCYNRLPTIT
jgi:hypothetical protein